MEEHGTYLSDPPLTPISRNQPASALRGAWEQTNYVVQLLLLSCIIQQQQSNQGSLISFGYLLTSGGTTRSSEKNEDEESAGGPPNGDRCPLSMTPDAITIGDAGPELFVRVSYCLFTSSPQTA
jgi:hypothetical protein